MATASTATSGQGKSVDLQTKGKQLIYYENPVQSAIVLVTGVAIFALLKYTQVEFFPLMCNLLLASLLSLVAWSTMSRMMNISGPPKSESLELSERAARRILDAIVPRVNNTVALYFRIGRVHDTQETAITLVGLFIISRLASRISPLTISFLIFLLLFSLPIVYQRNKTEADKYISKANKKKKEMYDHVDKKVLRKIPRANAQGSGHSAGASAVPTGSTASSTSPSERKTE